VVADMPQQGGPTMDSKPQLSPFYSAFGKASEGPDPGAIVGGAGGGSGAAAAAAGAGKRRATFAENLAEEVSRRLWHVR